MSQFENKPYKIWTLDRFPNKGWAMYDKLKNVDRFIFMEGKKVEPMPELQFLVEWVAKPGLAMDFWPNNSGSPLVGPQGMTFLQEFCPGDVQFFDTRIQCKDQVVTDYKLVNLTHECEAVDEARSECIPFHTGEFGYFNKFIFKDNPLEGHHFVREARMHSWKLCSKEFIEEYKRRKLKGLEFTTDDAHLLNGRDSFRKEPVAANQ